LDANATALGDAGVVVHRAWRVVDGTELARDKEAAGQLIR
jgi:hypothetical protein